jgi:hypothetical protein
MVGACQKANDVVVDSSAPINAQLTYFDKDSLDVAQYLSNSSLKPTISDSFQILLSSSKDFSHLNVQVQDDSGIVLNNADFTNVNGNRVAGAISTTLSSVYVGNLTYVFTAYNTHGASGNYAEKKLRLFNAKDAGPVIDSVSMPDSLILPQTNSLVFDIYAYVTDAAGLSDVSNVYFDVVKPDGTPSTGNPFMMYDDGGAAGLQVGDDDRVAHDGTYTLSVQLPAGTAVGTYTFTFHAVDRSGVSSAPVSHKIRIYQ